MGKRGELGTSGQGEEELRELREEDARGERQGSQAQLEEEE